MGAGKPGEMGDLGQHIVWWDRTAPPPPPVSIHGFLGSPATITQPAAHYVNED